MIAFSNLAFPAEEAATLLPRLASAGLKGVEVAPTRLAPWADLTPSMLAEHRAMLEGMGLSVPSLQAILFGAEGVALLGARDAFDRMLDHLRRVAAAASVLGAGVAVFGSPRQRSRGELTAEEAFPLGRDRFREAAELCWSEARLVLGLEPVPATYGGDFLASWQECLAMVQAVDHPGLRLHLDTGCVKLGGGDIAAAVAAGAPWLAHFHTAEPQLGEFAAPAMDHAAASRALATAGYGGWISIEMRQVDGWADAVPTALRFVKDCYGR